MRKFFVAFALSVLFLAVSCSSSKKAENDADILPDDEATDVDVIDENDIADDDADTLPDDEATDDDENNDELNDTDEYETEDIDPCEPNPCKNDTNSTGECIALNTDSYKCGCVEKYFWDGEKCVDPCAGIDCSQLDHASGTCNPKNAFAFSCDCDKGFWWWGKGCLKMKPGLAHICTGQTDCYDNKGKKINCPEPGEEFYGQDAQYAELGYCIKQSFSEKPYSQDESITIDNNLNIEWTTEVPYSQYAWEDAVKYCEDFEYAGYDDWRLPTIKELTLSNDPFFHEDESSHEKVANLWSSNECAEKDFQGWILNFRMTWDIYGKVFKGQVRCVRGEPIDEVISFDKLGKVKEEVAFDYENNLAWQLNTVSTTSWAKALAYCENSSYSGFSDWRLPNVHELASLVNHNKFNLATDLPLSLGSKAAWTSTTVYRDFLYQVFAVYFKDGAIDRFDKEDDRASIVCVRNEPCKRGWFWDGKKCVLSPCTDNPCKNEEHSDKICYLNDFESHACGCVENYFWDDDKCSSPCDPNPCKNDKKSTGECFARNLEIYSCGCIENYFWDGKKCANPCVGFNCGQFAHTVGECKSENPAIPICDCETGYWWHGKDKGCLKEKPAAVNVCTGQTLCYDNEKEMDCPAVGEEFFGQDATYARLGYCVPQSFSIDDSVAAEPVVIDNNLGLMWQQKIPPAEEHYIKDVIKYCEDLTYGGYDDWRLPTAEDFMTIADYGRYDPAANTEYFPDNGAFWTVSNYSSSLPYPFDLYQEYYTIFDFTNPSTRSVNTYSTGGGGYPIDGYPYTFSIRCVRGNTADASGYFMPETLGENLMWSDGALIVLRKTDMNYTWSEALKYCSELDYVGISDWRLPNIKEFTLGAGDKFVGNGKVRASTTKIFDQTSDHLTSGKENTVQGSIFCVTGDPCGAGTLWNGVKCVKNPCDPDPCESEDGLNKTCKVIDEETYFCGCSKCMYNVEHSNGKCYEDGIFGFYCGCEEGYRWINWEEEYGCYPN